MTQSIHRRKLLKFAVAGAASTTLHALTATPLLAAVNSSAPAASKSVRTTHNKCVIRLANTHTLEEINVVYKINGHYIPESLDRLDFHLRDHRENEARVMDPKLFDQLWELQQALGGSDVFEIISGYRSAQTNAKLRQTSRGVARNSYHIKGQALDIRLRNTPLSDLHQAALDASTGGVGRYTASDFIHIDTGPSRQWGA